MGLKLRVAHGVTKTRLRKDIFTGSGLRKDEATREHLVGWITHQIHWITHCLFTALLIRLGE